MLYHPDLFCGPERQVVKMDPKYIGSGELGLERQFSGSDPR